LVAAVAIAIAAWGRLWHPQPLGDVWLGLGVSLVATALNGVVAVVLWRAGRRLRSITLRADAKHLLTDVWTSAGVLAGVLLVPLTGWLRLAPLIALIVALNIVWTGLRLLHETGSGLLDAALPPEDRAVIDGVLASYTAQGVLFHAVRTRVAGQRRFVSLHVLVAGSLGSGARPRVVRTHRRRHRRTPAADHGVHPFGAMRGPRLLRRPGVGQPSRRGRRPRGVTVCA
jgi:cation diffusion facilitator family transporter